MISAIGPVNEDNIVDYKIRVHGIKGVCFEIFASEVGIMAKNLEEAANTGDLGFIHKNTPALIEAAQQFTQGVDSALSAIDDGTPRQAEDKPDSASLSKLLTACMCYDFAGAEEAMAEIARFKYSADGGLAEWLRERVDMMDFSQIVERLSSESGILEGAETDGL
jgi:hypothetical protein